MYKIYKYTNSVNGKVYIGQTCRSLDERAQSNGCNYKECPRFYNAIMKYGWDSFIPEILADGLTVEEANKQECDYIAMYQSTNPSYGYNILSGGLNRSMPDESRYLIAKKAKERYIDKTANPMFGKSHSDSTLKKMSKSKVGAKNPMYGTKWTETQRNKCGVRGKKLNLSDEQRRLLSKRGVELGESRRKPVRCIEDSLDFKSLQDAAEYFGVKICSLCDQLHGRSKSCRGKHFEYII